jgi:hypothetical protein
MKRERLPWALGWMSVGVGLTELTFPERLCRVLGVPGRSGLMRVLGVREIATGLGLLLQPRRQWVWARVAGDAVDLALLAGTFGRPRANRVWQGLITAAVAGATLVDILVAAGKPSASTHHAGTVTPSRGRGVGSSGPAESWRGSGLAEDVGLNRRPGEEGESEAVKRRMMREAARELGLPEEPGEHGSRG